MKCKFCKKEFEPKSKNQVFCDWDCQYAYRLKKYNLERQIDRLAKKYDFDLKNKDKIVRAKMMLFSQDNALRCPCDSKNPKRFCGSPLCIHDTVHYGHCCCNMFHLKEGETPVCQSNTKSI